MEPTPSNGGAHTPIPGDWQPTPDSPRKSLTLNDLCLALNILVILTDAARVLELLSSWLQRRIVTWSPLLPLDSTLPLDGTAARVLSFLGSATEFILKDYIVLKLLVWLVFRVSTPFSQLFECVSVILLSAFATVNSADPVTPLAEPARTAPGRPVVQNHDSPQRAPLIKMNPTVARPSPRPQSIRTLELKTQDCSNFSRRKVLYASNIPRRTPHFSSSTHATKQRDPNKTEMPSLIPLPLTPLQVSPLPPRPFRAPPTRTNALSGAPVNVPNSSIGLDQETERGGNLQVPAGGGVHHPSQVRVSTDCDGPAQPTNDLDWGGLRAGIATHRRFSFIKRDVDWSSLPQPPISCEHSKAPGGSLPSTPPSIRNATTPGSICFALPSPRSPFAGVTASIIALGRRTRNVSLSEDREGLLSKKAMAHNSCSTSGDGRQKSIESHCRSSPPRASKLSPAIDSDDGTGHDGAQCQPPALADVQSDGVAVSSAVSNVQTVVAPLDQEASLDFPSTASAIFPSLLSEPFDSSDMSLAKHFNDIDLASPAAQRCLRSTTPSLESLDALVRYMLEGDVDLLHSSFAKGDGRHSRERVAYAERARSPASVTSAGLIARLESTPKSANILHRGPRHSAACDSAFRVGVSNPSLLREGMTESWRRTEHRGPKRDTPISQEDLTDSMDLALANFKFCDSFGPTTSLLAPSLRITQTPSPARQTTHFRLRRTDDEKHPSWKF